MDAIRARTIAGATLAAASLILGATAWLIPLGEATRWTLLGVALLLLLFGLVSLGLLRTLLDRSYVPEIVREQARRDGRRVLPLTPHFLPSLLILLLILGGTGGAFTTALKALPPAADEGPAASGPGPATGGGRGFPTENLTGTLTIVNHGNLPAQNKTTVDGAKSFRAAVNASLIKVRFTYGENPEDAGKKMKLLLDVERPGAYGSRQRVYLYGREGASPIEFRYSAAGLSEAQFHFRIYPVDTMVFNQVPYTIQVTYE